MRRVMEYVCKIDAERNKIVNIEKASRCADTRVVHVSVVKESRKRATKRALRVQTGSSADNLFLLFSRFILRRWQILLLSL